MRPCSLRTHHGSSLLEALIGLLLLSGMASAAVGALPRMSVEYFVRTESEALRRDLVLGSLDALRYEHPITVTLSPDGWTLVGRGGETRTRHLAHDVHLGARGPGDAGSELTLHAHGVCTPATVRLEAGGHQCAVVVSLRCRVRTVC